MRHLRSAALMGIALIVTACGSKPDPVPAAPTQVETRRPTDDGDAARRAEEEARRRAAEEARRAEETARRNAAVLAERVFFDYDVATIRDDARRTLDAKTPILRGDATLRLRIEGHADDRGSTEYNLALGQRRAQAVKDYLVGFGLDASRFEIVSYGEERPLVQGRGETSWAQNRRGEFVVMGGRVAMGDAR